MSPADVVKFETKALQGGRPVKVYVEHETTEPVSREGLLHMVLASSLLLEETEATMPPRERRRSELLRERMEDAMKREQSK